MATIHKITEDLFVICSALKINLLQRSESLSNFTLISLFDIDDLIEKGCLTKKNKTDKNKLLCSATSNDGKRLAIGTSSKLLLIFDLNRECPQFSKPFICQLTKAPTKICFLSNETVLVSNRFGSLLKFEITESEISEGIELLGHFSMLLDFCISPNGKFVITADRDEKIRISRFPQTFVIEGFCLGHTSFVKSIEWIDNDKLIRGDSIIYLWDLISFKCISKSCKVAETPIRKIEKVEISQEDQISEGIICLPDESNSILLFSLDKEQQKITKLCSFVCPNKEEFIFDFCIDLKNTIVYCVGRQGIYNFSTKNLPSTNILELKQIKLLEQQLNLEQQLTLSKDLLPLKTLFKVALNGKNIEDYKNKKEEKLIDKKKKIEN